MTVRFDELGLFWQDVRDKRNRPARQIAPIPETGWLAPTAFPNLSSEKTIAFDVETYDPHLVDLPGEPARGPGWARGDGHIVGASIGVPGGGRWYFPTRHEVMPEHNLDPNQVYPWLDYVLNDNRPKVGANLTYDVGWCRETGIRVGGPLYDVQFAEALLNSETPSVALEELAHIYLGEGKQSHLLYDWCAESYGGRPTERQRRNIYRAPPCLVGPYGESDADLPLRILMRQWPLLEQNELLGVFNMECGLIRLMIEMRYRGATVDVAAAEQLSGQLQREIGEIDAELHRIVGFEVNTAASASLAKAFNELGLEYGYTAPTENNPQGNPSFTASFLESVNHPFAKLVVERKQKFKLKRVFIDSYIIKNHVNGKLHCTFTQLKGDESGARSGRYASQDPNLQNIPIRTTEGKRIRKLFITRGIRYRKFDQSQIEYRMLAHHAVGPKSDEIRARYNENPNTDYHEMIQEMIKRLVNVDLDRRHTKTVNFGIAYGMSEHKLIADLGLTPEAGKKLFKSIHQAVPFARATMQDCSNFVTRHGFITTILGRRSQFPLWLPKSRRGVDNRQFKPLLLADALREYHAIERAFLHKALNRRLQGGAADVMKKGMYDCYLAGVFDDTGYPSLTVHDELDFEDENGNEVAFREMKHILETCIPQLRVPLLVDEKQGPTWGDAD